MAFMSSGQSTDSGTIIPPIIEIKQGDLKPTLLVDLNKDSLFCFTLKQTILLATIANDRDFLYQYSNILEQRVEITNQLYENCKIESEHKDSIITAYKDFKKVSDSSMNNLIDYSKKTEKKLEKRTNILKYSLGANGIFAVIFLLILL